MPYLVRWMFWFVDLRLWVWFSLSCGFYHHLSGASTKLASDYQNCLSHQNFVIHGNPYEVPSCSVTLAEWPA
jgi:hypothetical protein